MKLNRWTTPLQGRDFRNATNANWDMLENLATDLYLEIKKALGIIDEKEAALYRYIITEDNQLREHMKSEDDALRTLIADNKEELETDLRNLDIEVNNRVDNLINSTPQPSEIVDARTDKDGKVYTVLRERLTALQVGNESKLQVFHSIDDIPKMETYDWLMYESNIINDIRTFVNLDSERFPLTFVKEVDTEVPISAMVFGNLGDSNFPVTNTARIRLSSKFKFGSAYIYGVYVGEVTAFQTVVDGVTYSGGDPSQDGTFKIYVSGRVLATSINVIVIAFSKGKELTRMQVFNDIIN
ncbi:hypothetical protein HB904_17010 [Listeria booriae]|uniref:Bacterial Ig domain-containing protein n=1 Tax=Listeria booriae TaxID=1552123 RepID=A0A842AMZ8_9LIST|nr:immunoglobulin-like domain-containing protein [Listeria booriae]MBC1402148.1 hypothetical protein [Listeria booriae]MBC1617880.1 hypothetical protein [Listeria booriae]